MEMNRRREEIVGIAYQVPCGGCECTYKEESRRDNFVRINDHRRDITAYRA